MANLFEISILFCCIEFIGKKLFGKKKNLIFQGVISGVFLALGYYCSIYNIRFDGLQRIFSCYVLFYLGYLVNKLSTVKTGKKIIVNILGCMVGLCILLILNKTGYINLAHNEYINPIYLLLCALFGGVLIYSMAMIFSNFKYISSILCLVGKNTFSIMVLHFLCFKIVNYIGVSIEGKPLYFVAAFPILYTGKYIWLVYTVVGLIVPILCKLAKNVVFNYIYRVKSSKGS